MLVLSNSLGTTLEMWDPQLPALTERFRVVRYDRRGHGRSPVPPGPYTIDDLGGDVLALLDRLELERVSFCGLSIGGAVGMWLAAEAPERIDRLVLCCTKALFAPPEQWTERAATVRAGGVATVSEATLGRWFTPAFHTARPDVVERFRAMLVGTPPEGYAGCCEALAGTDLRARLGVISAPTLVITGEHDPVAPPPEGEELAAAIPGARHVVVERRRAHRQRRAARSLHGGAGRAPDPDLAGGRMTDAFERGMKVRREVLGDAHVDAAVARTTPFTADFQDLITRYAWGEIWARPGLDRRTRSCITLTALVALGREDELAMHVRAALRNGLTPDEIGEVLLQTAVYCGVPAANGAFAVADRVLREEAERPA